MKFGEYLRDHKEPEWVDWYLDYDRLKGMIKDLEQKHLVEETGDTSRYGTSLSVPRPTNAAGMPMDQNQQTETSQELFFNVLEQEMRKIEQFTKKQVREIRQVLQDVEKLLSSTKDIPEGENISLKQKVENIGENFLKLEKYVNLNVTGFHKILKKHDRRLPNPCKAFYTRRLHDQSWVRGDYSDVIVAMSRVYSILRHDEQIEEVESEKQNFVRSTRKYWVHMEDVSRVKYIVLQHLPVFLQNTMAGETDSQLVNSVYLDNHSMELYHGRLNKTPGAIALRFRWYGTGSPNVVFVERKTHRESWAGELSVKERFTIKDDQVQSLLDGNFDTKKEISRMHEKGKSEDDIKEWSDLAQEVIQAITSKQLVPTMRTQYMRTAFQIPFDATVRISLDTNLCMISERSDEVASGIRWYRDPTKAVPLNEITRFPHAILEIKLQMQDESKTPTWVQELLDSGMLMEVHKFSKFIHGSAVLLPDDVSEIPYWIDDVTLAQSIQQSGNEEILKNSVGANEYYKQLLPHDSDGISKVRKLAEMTKKQPIAPNRSVEVESAFESQQDDECLAQWCELMEESDISHVTIQKVEPKVFLANERTFIKWLQMAVVLSSFSIGILAFANKTSSSQYFAIALLPMSLLFIVHALRTFLWRSKLIRNRDATRWDDPVGPVLLTSLIIIALVVHFMFTVYNLLHKV